MHAVPSQIASVDGEVFPLPRARKIARGLFFAGFAGLPLLWITNVWLFWPCFRSKEDEIVARYARWSLFGFLAACLLFLPWLVFFSAFGSAYLSPELYAKLDITQLPLRDYGI